MWRPPPPPPQSSLHIHRAHLWIHRALLHTEVFTRSLLPLLTPTTPSPQPLHPSSKPPTLFLSPHYTIPYPITLSSHPPTVLLPTLSLSPLEYHLLAHTQETCIKRQKRPICTLKRQKRPICTLKRRKRPICTLKRRITCWLRTNTTLILHSRILQRGHNTWYVS